MSNMLLTEDATDFYGWSDTIAAADRRFDRDNHREGRIKLAQHGRCHCGCPLYTLTEVDQNVCVDCASDCVRLHAAAQASLATFTNALRQIGEMDSGEEGTKLLLANCPRCATTLAFEVPL